MLNFQKQPLECNFSLTIADEGMLGYLKHNDQVFFNSLELNKEYFEDLVKLFDNNPQKFENISKIILNLNIDPSVAKEIVEQNSNIKEDFCYEIASQINLLSNQLTDIIVNFNLDEAMRNKYYRQNLEKLIKSIYKLLNSKRNILLSLKIPNADNNIFNFAHKFLTNFSFPIKIALEINPHKLSEKSNYLSYINQLRHYINLFKITYDVTSGHKLRTKNIIPIFEQLQKQHYDNCIALNIVGARNENLPHIINDVEEVFKECLKG